MSNILLFFSFAEQTGNVGAGCCFCFWREVSIHGWSYANPFWATHLRRSCCSSSTYTDSRTLSGSSWAESICSNSVKGCWTGGVSFLSLPVFKCDGVYLQQHMQQCTKHLNDSDTSSHTDTDCFENSRENDDIVNIIGTWLGKAFVQSWLLLTTLLLKDCFDEPKKKWQCFFMNLCFAVDSLGGPWSPTISCLHHTGRSVSLLLWNKFHHSPAHVLCGAGSSGNSYNSSSMVWKTWFRFSIGGALKTHKECNSNSAARWKGNFWAEHSSNCTWLWPVPCAGPKWKMDPAKGRGAADH